LKLNIQEARMKTKKISLIVPVYKAESFIRKNLEEMKKSISKIFPNYEIIAVIDGEVDNSKKEAEKVLSKTFQVIDKAAKRGIIKKNNASRKKSRLAKLIK